jgi:serine-type D-Ala-D-Ala carboxypeptidase/endopeptidase (penicillin-binding protein 4)
VPNQQRPHLNGLAVGIWGRHELYVQSLAALLGSRGADVRLATGSAAEASLGRVHVLLAESPLPFELERLCAIGPPVIVLDELSRPEDTVRARALGATAVVEKNAGLAQLSIAIKRAGEEARSDPLRDLTRRQLEVLKLVAEGMENAQIASRLGISQRTARSHVSSVLSRLGVENRTQAAVTAVRRGLLAFASLLMIFVGLLAVAKPAPAAAADGSRAAVAAQLRALGGASGAWIADAASAKQLAARNSEQARTPASVQKLFTTATALERMGPEARIPTTARATGLLDAEGTLDGSLYIEGFGDPSFGGAGLSRLARKVRDAGIRRVTGRVYGDEGFFDSRRGLPAGGFRMSYDVGPLSALSFNNGTLRGFGRGFQRNPPLFVAQRFRAALASRGVKVKRAARAGDAPDDARKLGTANSPALSTLVRHTNQVSDNYFAETLLKGLGARFSGSGSTTAGTAVVNRFVTEIGARSTARDGSGLSRGNAVSPRTVGRLLLDAQSEPWFDSFYRSLPLAGHSGTLRKRMRGSAANGRCRAKTGTLIGVSALAGYCRSRAGRRIVFALLMNGVSVYSARRTQDRIAAALAADGAP